MQAFKTRVFLRFHMSLILIGTALVGLLVSKLLLMTHVTSMLIRYPIAVVASYLAFFGFIRLWLSYISSSNTRNSSDDPCDVLDITTNVPDFSGGGVRMPSSGTFAGGGGGTGGGAGATGSFDVGASEPATQLTTMFDSIGSAEGVGKAGEAVGDAASGFLEDGGLVLIVLGALLAIVFGAGLYMVYDAPFILSEAAFDFILSAGLIRSMKTMDAAEWHGSILRTTWKPFVGVLLIALVAAAIIHSFFPDAHKLSEIF